MIDIELETLSATELAAVEEEIEILDSSIELENRISRDGGNGGMTHSC